MQQLVAIKMGLSSRMMSSGTPIRPLRYTLNTVQESSSDRLQRQMEPTLNSLRSLQSSHALMVMFLAVTLEDGGIMLCQRAIMHSFFWNLLQEVHIQIEVGNTLANGVVCQTKLSKHRDLIGTTSL